MIDPVRLPGPLRLLDRIRENLAAGNSTVLVQPASLDYPLGDEVIKLLRQDERSFHRVTATIHPVEDIDRTIPGGISTPTVAAAIEACGRFAPSFVVEITEDQCWREWRKWLERFRHHCQQLPTAHRPTLALFLRGFVPDEMPTSDVALTIIDRRDAWSEVDALAVAEAEFLPPARTTALLRRVLIHTVARLALWDHGLARQLSQAGADAILNPNATLRAYALARGWRASIAPSEIHGSLAYFDHELRPHSAHLALIDDQVRLMQRLWRAQMSVLLPWGEEQRLKLVESARRYLPAGEATEMEIGPMYYQLAAGSAPLGLTREANRLRHLRNTLAHRGILSLQEIRELGK